MGKSDKQRKILFIDIDGMIPQIPRRAQYFYDQVDVLPRILSGV